jgi:hypothetical protein
MLCFGALGLSASARSFFFHRRTAICLRPPLIVKPKFINFAMHQIISFPVAEKSNFWRKEESNVSQQSNNPYYLSLILIYPDRNLTRFNLYYQQVI